MRDLLTISWRRCTRPWRLSLCALAVCVIASGWCWKQRGASLETRQATLARRDQIRRMEYDAAARRARAEAEDALAKRLLDSPLARSSLGAVQELRLALNESGISGASVEAGESLPAGSVGVVTIRIRAKASYSSVRMLLATLDDREVPVGWKRLAYDGERFEAEMTVLARTES